MLPLAWSWGLRDAGGIGWPLGILLMILGGPGLSILSHAGFILAPLGHGAVIQPSTATLGGLLLATLVLREPSRRARVLGALTIVCGLVLMGVDALINIGTHALGGDTLFIAAGLCWATMLTLLRLRQIDSVRATVIISVLSLLIYAPLHALVFGFQNILAVGWKENVLQIVTQGILSGPLATYLAAYAASVLGTGRGATFSALVPVFTILAGVLALGELPTLIQLMGLAVVAVGFRLVMSGSSTYSLCRRPINLIHHGRLTHRVVVPRRGRMQAAGGSVLCRSRQFRFQSIPARPARPMTAGSNSRSWSEPSTRATCPRRSRPTRNSPKVPPARWHRPIEWAPCKGSGQDRRGTAIRRHSSGAAGAVVDPAAAQSDAANARRRP